MDEMLLSHALGENFKKYKKALLTEVVSVASSVCVTLVTWLLGVYIRKKKALSSKELGNPTAQYQPNQNRFQKSLTQLLCVSNYQTSLQCLFYVGHNGEVETADRRGRIFGCLFVCIHVP